MYVSAKFCGSALLLGFITSVSPDPADAEMDLHGRAPAAIDGINWYEALEKVPCADITKIGNGLKIAATLVINGTHHKNPMISEKDQIDLLEKRCPPKKLM